MNPQPDHDHDSSIKRDYVLKDEFTPAISGACTSSPRSESPPSLLGAKARFSAGAPISAAAPHRRSPFSTPVIKNGCFASEKFSIVNVCPTTSVLPKYFIASSAVMIVVKGWCNALCASPYIKEKPSIFKMLVSPMWMFSRKLLLSFEILEVTPS
jgi:hypothetical protein